MAQASSPSDYDFLNSGGSALYSPDYNTGQGYYTSVEMVSDLLQIPSFTGSTNPTEAQVGAYIKRVEDYVDTKTGTSFRPITYFNEYHNFEFKKYNNTRVWFDAVSFIQLLHPDVRKVIRLEVWQGNAWTELASAVASIEFDSTNLGSSSSIVLTLPDGSTSFTLSSGTTNAHFNNNFGTKTSAQELVYLINEQYPASTVDFATTAAKRHKSGDGVSKYFYATIDSENQNKVIISSLLPSDDGSGCTIASSSTGVTVANFTDNEEMARTGNWWKIDNEGRIFFRKKYPYHEQNSIRVTYVSGKSRVPGIITDAATKLVACEILRHDDQTVLIAESGAQIDIKSKYDLLKKEADDLLNMGKETVFFID
jgi:hypothetical protein